jgi:flagellar protein FlgJ
VIAPLRPPATATSPLALQAPPSALPVQAPATSLAPQDPATATQRNALRGAAQQFEAVFLRQMIGSMRQAHLADDMFGSQATDQFRDMADANLADSMSHQGVFGIAQMLLGQFDRHAAAATPTGAAGQNAAATEGNPTGSGQ